MNDEMLRSVCVFCGSSSGQDPRHVQRAQALGRALAGMGTTVVYGGGSVGLMGALACAALDAGGQVIGVIPQALADLEVAHLTLSRLEIVDDMHTRKARMAELSDGFVVLPGGIGTLEEMFEIWTWGQLGFHNKPLGLLDSQGYFQPLIQFLDHMVSGGFLKQQHRDMLIVDTDIESLLRRMAEYSAPSDSKWIKDLIL